MAPLAPLPTGKARLSMMAVSVALLLFAVSMHTLTGHAQQGGDATGGQPLVENLRVDQPHLGALQ